MNFPYHIPIYRCAFGKHPHGQTTITKVFYLGQVFTNPTACLRGAFFFEWRIFSALPPSPQIVDSTEQSLPCPLQNAPIQSAPNHFKREPGLDFAFN